jgi:hypothetical protein
LCNATCFIEALVLSPIRPLLFLAASALVLAACADSSNDERVLTPVDDDAYGQADVGTDADGSEDAIVVDADGGRSDTGADVDADNGSGDGLCRPNRDGVIERHEVPLRVGQHATFKIGLDATIDTAGQVVDGRRIWDLSGDLAGDRRELLELRSPSTMWFGARFTDATYFTRLSASTTLYGVFRLDDDALQLLGVASEDDGLWRTELRYDPPVDVLRFPFEEGSSWQTSSRVTGLASGVAVLYDETYTYTVDRQGTLKTPFGEFEALRVRSELERVVGLLTTRVRTYLFAAECFGTVASIVSRDNEADQEFTRAAEVRRLAP